MARPSASAVVVLLGLLLAACAGKPTPYQQAQGGYGYSEQRIEENRYRVSFAGNSATSRQTVEDYLLYRAAELTVQNGHDWFEVAARDTVQEYAGYGGSPAMGNGRRRRVRWCGRRTVLSDVRRGRRRAQLHGAHGHPRARRREAGSKIPTPTTRLR